MNLLNDSGSRLFVRGYSLSNWSDRFRIQGYSYSTNKIKKETLKTINNEDALPQPYDQLGLGRLVNRFITGTFAFDFNIKGLFIWVFAQLQLLPTALNCF